MWQENLLFNHPDKLHTVRNMDCGVHSPNFSHTSVARICVTTRLYLVWVITNWVASKNLNSVGFQPPSTMDCRLRSLTFLAVLVSCIFIWQFLWVLLFWQFLRVLLFWQFLWVLLFWQFSYNLKLHFYMAIWQFLWVVLFWQFFLAQCVSYKLGFTRAIIHKQNKGHSLLCCQLDIRHFQNAMSFFNHMNNINKHRKIKIIYVSSKGCSALIYAQEAYSVQKSLYYERLVRALPWQESIVCPQI